MKILVYDDNPDYGGHQVMACHGVEALAADPAVEVVFMFNPANRKLAEKLPILGNVQCLEASHPAKTFQTLEPDLVLCIQGDIAQCSKGLLVAKQAGIECVSYIAIPHRLADMGARLGALRDRMNRHLFNRPDRFIAISESMKQILLERGVDKPIAIVPNGIPSPATSNRKPQAANPVLGLLGRVEFNQKQQDFMVRTFLGNPRAFGDCRLLIAGNGPDEDKLRKMVEGKENIDLMPWQENPETFYGQIDFLVIPSRYEGVPLVMLEALARGIPTLGSARDGMKDMLPEAWTFEPENARALASTFSNVRKTWKTKIDSLQAKVQDEHSLEAFKARFREAVAG
jgi:glycosyltransferase involved in cell wall biosynthesis